MKFCINCGKKIKKGTKFCPYCGAKQNVSTAVNQAQSAPNKSTQYKSRDNNYQTYQSVGQQPQMTGSVIKKRIVPPKCSFVKAFKLFWENYVNFGGYSSRSEFWWWFLIEYIIDTIISMHVSASLSAAGFNLFDVFNAGDSDVVAQSPIEAVVGALGIAIVWYLVILIPNLSLRARRFRDAGVSNGWIVAILICDYVPVIIPIFGWLISLAARIATLVFELMPSVRLIPSK